MPSYIPGGIKIDHDELIINHNGTKFSLAEEHIALKADIAKLDKPYNGLKAVSTYVTNSTEINNVVNAFQHAYNLGFRAAQLTNNIPSNFTTFAATAGNTTVLETVIQKLKNIGYTHIMVKLHFLTTAGNINTVTDVDFITFLTSYKTVLEQYATLCQNNGVDIFVITNECPSVTTKTALLDTWNTIYTAVRAIYKGKITHSMTYEESFKFLLYDKEDVICINSYPSLSYKLDYTLDECLQAKELKKHINNYKNLKIKYNKDIYITEFGCQNRKGRLAAPGYFGTDTDISEATQQMFYEVFLKSLSTLDFISGAYIWECCYDFTPFGKLAEQTIIDEWGLSNNV